MKKITLTLCLLPVKLLNWVIRYIFFQIQKRNELLIIFLSVKAFINYSN